ncbi:OmpA family protein [Hymenobacter volaticus]|uniref:OmpA family protein n=1 Tax=Hymenobacter volaticus TaxID=2932254 RepID=A0ABY4G9U7_9BACT|nr:OmpA family protein [Hymenobacter volaticus]UOQ67675.1 OmpA family protein [Hymenobacter volaticus]
MMGIKREETVLEVVSSCIRAEHLNQLSVLVGQNSAATGQALAQLLPPIVSTLADRAAQPDGVDFVWDVIRQAQADQVLAQLDAMDVASWHGRGVLLLRNLLDDTYQTTIYRLATKAGLSLESYAPLLEAGVAVVLGALGKYTAEHNLRPDELGDWLQSEAKRTNSVVSPPNPDAEVFRPTALRQTTPTPTFAARAGQWQEVGGGSIFIPQPAAPEAKASKRHRWVWPLLLLLGSALGYGIFRWTSTPAPQVATGPSVPAAYTGATTQPRAAAPPTDATVPVSEVPAGQPLVITLFNGTTLKVSSNSTEYQLYNFLADPTQQVDPLNAAAGWISVDKVSFNPGQATLTANSWEQLRNLATILRTFPRAQLLFGGYTDKQKNLRLSEARAQSAMRALVAQGISSRRLQAIGSDEAAPASSNSTPEGQTLDRQLRIKVTTKLGPLLETPGAPLLAAAPVAKPADSPGAKVALPQDTVSQLTDEPVVATEIAPGEGPVEPVIEQAEADSRYQVTARMAYLFAAPNQAKATKRYLRKGEILYGGVERNGLVKIKFWNPNGALATGWLKLKELQKLSDDEAVTPTQSNSEPDSAEDTPSGSNDSASTETVP